MTSLLAAGIVITFGRSGSVKPSQAACDFPFLFFSASLSYRHVYIDGTKCIFAACLHISLPDIRIDMHFAGTVHTQSQPALSPNSPPLSLSLSPGFRAANNILTFNSTFVFGRCRCCHSKRSRQPPPAGCCMPILLLHQQLSVLQGGNHVSDNLFLASPTTSRIYGIFRANFSCRTVHLNGKHCATCSRNSCSR